MTFWINGLTLFSRKSVFEKFVWRWKASSNLLTNGLRWIIIYRRQLIFFRVIIAVLSDLISTWIDARVWIVWPRPAASPLATQTDCLRNESWKSRRSFHKKGKQKWNESSFLKCTFLDVNAKCAKHSLIELNFSMRCSLSCSLLCSRRNKTAKTKRGRELKPKSNFMEFRCFH